MIENRQLEILIANSEAVGINPKIICVCLYLQPQENHNSVFGSSLIFDQYQEKEHCKKESKLYLLSW